MALALVSAANRLSDLLRAPNTTPDADVAPSRQPGARASRRWAAGPGGEVSPAMASVHHARSHWPLDHRPRGEERARRLWVGCEQVPRVLREACASTQHASCCGPPLPAAAHSA